jgi:ubiquitin C-terminal hydrolase
MTALRKRKSVKPQTSKSDVAELDDNISDPYGPISEPITSCPAGDHRKKKNCANNPWCLSDLIDEKKGIWKPNPTCLLNLGYDPAFLRRGCQGKSGKLIPSGIQNLGATCYLNVLIQMLHQNLLVRDAIFNMQPNSNEKLKSVKGSDIPLKISRDDIPKFEKDSHMKMVVSALQDTFGHLSSCLRGEYDPSLFVDLLELNKTEQQDPQEFSKLFFAKLEESQLPLRDSTLPDIKQLISGKETYSTTCTACGLVSSQSNEFREIGLNIEKCPNLQDAIDGYQKIEIMEGENQFLCSACNRKTNATRCVEISEAPDLLILKLMRYYYDRTTCEKKKSQTSLEFPAELNLNGEEFELVAVLYHKGSSAYGGHYVAELLEWDDREVPMWWLFDDCLVSPTLNPASSFAIKRENKAASDKGKGKGKRGRKPADSASKEEPICVEMDVDEDNGKRSESWNLDPGSGPACVPAKKGVTSKKSRFAFQEYIAPLRSTRSRGHKEIDVLDLSDDMEVGVVNDLTSPPTDKEKRSHRSAVGSQNLAEADIVDTVQANTKRKRGAGAGKSAAETSQDEDQDPVEADRVPKLHSPNLDRSKVRSAIPVTAEISCVLFFHFLVSYLIFPFF